jgi:hypothetical protein
MVLFAALHESGSVQVFGCRRRRPSHALRDRRPKSAIASNCCGAKGSDAIGAKRTCRERRERVDLTKMTRCRRRLR